MKNRLLLGGILLLFFTAAQAQNNDDLLRLLLQKGIVTQSEIDSLQREAHPATAPAPLPETSPVSGTNKNPGNTTAPERQPFKPTFKFGGVGHIAYQVEKEDGRYSNAFSLVRVCGLVNAEVMRDFRIVAMFYFNPRPMQHMHEFYFQWQPLPEVGVSGGLQKVPLTLGNLLSPANIETINPSRLVRNVAGGAEDIRNGVNTGRDLGVEVIGELFPMETHRLLAYKVGLFNGIGAGAVWDARFKDNDNYKDFVAWLFVQPVKGWRIGGSMLQTCRFGYSRNAVERTVWNASGEYDDRYCTLRVEYLNGKRYPADNWGVNTLALWKACKWADVVFSYDYYRQQGSGAGMDKSYDYMAGINLKFNRMCRLQTFYIYSSQETAPFEKQTFITQLQIGF